MSVEFTEAMLLGDENEAEGHVQCNQMENNVESEMQSLSLEKTMTPFEQERVAGQPVRGTTVLDELPRALEDIPDDVVLAYAKRRLEAKEPKRMPAGHRTTPDGKDTSALSLFYSCAGSGFDTKLNYNFHCSVRGMSSKMSSHRPGDRQPAIQQHIPTGPPHSDIRAREATGQTSIPHERPEPQPRHVRKRPKGLRLLQGQLCTRFSGPHAARRQPHSTSTRRRNRNRHQPIE